MHLIVDCVEAGCVACDDDGGGGGGVRNRAVHSGEAVWSRLPAEHRRWSTGSPARSSYHSPGPLNQHHPLEGRDRKGNVTE